MENEPSMHIWTSNFARSLLPLIANKLTEVPKP